MAEEREVTIGVLALQGAFREHAQHLSRLSLSIHHPPSRTAAPTTALAATAVPPAQAQPLASAASSSSSPSSSPSSSAQPVRIKPVLVRSPAELQTCDALIIPGGESTAIALGAQRANLLEPLREWVRQDRPTWGTCAGMILLAREASGGKRSGQELLGGIDVRVGRNGFGSQVDSFEHSLDIPALATMRPTSKHTASHAASSSGGTAGPAAVAPGDVAPFPGIFIRAPVVDALLLPEDISAVAPDEVTNVQRQPGEEHAGARIVKQEASSPAANPASNAAPDTAAATAAATTTTPPSTAPRKSTSYVSHLPDGRTTTIVVAPPLEAEGESRRPRPPLEILASLPHLPARSAALESASAPAAAAASAGAGGVGGRNRGEVEARPAHDSQIVALKQGRLMATSFHPELSADLRLHELFVRRCVLE